MGGLGLQMQLRNAPSLFTILPAAADQTNGGHKSLPGTLAMSQGRLALPVIPSTGHNEDPEWHQLPAAQPAHTLPSGNRAEG